MRSQRACSCFVIGARNFSARSARESGTLETAGILPFWIELSLYASMPLFHVHTFLALSIALVFWLLTEPRTVKKHIFVLLSAALMPATGIVWLITDHFRAKSILAFQPGWVQSSGDFASSFPRFWLMNFGITLPLILVLIGVLCWRTWRTRSGKRFSLPEPLAFALPAAAIFFLLASLKPLRGNGTTRSLSFGLILFSCHFCGASLSPGGRNP